MPDDMWAERFNKFHAPAGSAAGGQFAPASGSSSGGKGKPAGKAGKDTRPAPSNARPVGKGETGKRVSDLQARLNALGAKPPLKLDGIFGPKTLAAVREFQRTHKDAQGRPLKVDGLVGPLTTAALRATTHPAAHHPAAHHPAAHHPAAHHPAAKTTTVKHPAAKPSPAVHTTAHRSGSDIAGHALYVQRSRELRERYGLVW